MFKIVEAPIRMEDLIAAVSHESVGGLATFLGTVRSENAGRRVIAVEYHAYPAMAEKVMREIGEEIRRGFSGARAAMAHRVGRLVVGDSSIAIAVGSAHRREALGGVAYAIERIKQVAPIWKKEFYADGSAWLDPVPSPSLNSSDGNR